MDDLIAFVHARLAEDEEAAQAASQSSWTNEHGELQSRGDSPNFQHLLRHSPARVLREVEVKRRILDLHPREIYRRQGEEHGAYCGCQCPDGIIEGHWPCDTVRLLALPYADHPEYLSGWAPKE